MIWIFITSIIGILYTYAGYPLILAIIARSKPRPRCGKNISPAVAIVIVGYNEAHRLDAKIQTCLNQTYPKELIRLIIASDGSTDHTTDVTSKYNEHKVSLLQFDQRRGKAACLNDALSSISEEVVVLTDARQRLSPDAVEKLVFALADPDVGAVSGELVFENPDASDFSAGIDAYWKYEKFIRHNESISGSVIGVTGALYALKRQYFKPIPAETILDDVLIPMQVAMTGKRVLFEKGAIAYDLPSASAKQERTRKIRTLAGNFQILALAPELLSPIANPLFFRYLSHKVMRLLAPIFLIGAFISNALLIDSGAFFQILMAGQLAMYGGALMSQYSPTLNAISIFRLAHSFLSLNWFVLLGLHHYLTNTNAHIWQRSAEASPNGDTPKNPQ